MFHNACPLGGVVKTVEADETELAKSRKTKRSSGHKRRDNVVVISLVERDGGRSGTTPATTDGYKQASPPPTRRELNRTGSAASSRLESTRKNSALRTKVLPI
jgi:hypothetical protein